MIEAMKQWLAALENASEYIQAEHDQRKEMYEPYGMVHKYSTEAQNLLDNKQAITSLRQAIEQAEKHEPVAFKQFLSDVHTAAGLVTHGKQCKALGERLSEGVMRYMATPPKAQRECEGCDKMAKP